MSEAIIKPLRPKAKDATGAMRQQRFRKKRKTIVTVVPDAPPASMATPSPPPLAGRDIAKPEPQRNGGAGIDVAAYTAAIALAAAAAFFSIKGMVVIFPGSPVPVIGMAIAMEAAKLITAGWLARRWSATAVVWRLALIAFVVGLAVINATGVFAQLVSAHVGERGAATSRIEEQTAELEARTDVQAHKVADLDRRLSQ